jgi:hypothetical protein
MSLVQAKYSLSHSHRITHTGGKPVREMSKREQVEALLALYQQREVPILRGMKI